MSLHRTGTIVMDQEPKTDKKPEPWGKLVPISQGLATVQISTDNLMIGRNPECTLQIHDKRLSGKHCLIVKFQNKVSITDLSTNGTYLGDKKIGKNKTLQLKDNNQIWLLPSSRVSPTQTLGFKVELLFERKINEEKEAKKKEMQEQQEQKKKQQQEQKRKQQEEQKRKKQEQEKAKKQEQEKAKKQQQRKEQQKKKKEQESKADSFANKLKQQITCSFCYEIMYIPVSVQPCNHRFCGACLTDLVIAKKQQCITCRKDITTAVRDSIFNSIIEDYLKSHPEEKRSDKEEQEARKKNIFGHDPIDIPEKIHGKKIIPAKTKAVIDPPSTRGVRKSRGRGLMRTGSDLSASDDDESSGKKCRQCLHERNGFKCTSSQVHVQCHTCAKLMPNRDDPSLHQYCVLCTTNFCNLYFPPCARSGSKLDLLKNKRSGVKINEQLLRGNTFQYEAIKNHLISKKQTSKDVFDFMMKEIEKKNFSYLFDRKIMKMPPIVTKEVPLTTDSAVCDLCWPELWFQMVFAYRTAQAAQFPTAVKDRPQCYWGINCRTMDHNKDHARRYNHILYQTRFS